MENLQPPRRATQLAARPHAVSKANTFVVLTNADLASLSPEDTIRVSSTAHSRPSFPSPLLSQKKELPATDDPSGHRDGSRSRSPIKGLFPTQPDPITGRVQSFVSQSSVDFDQTGVIGPVNVPHQAGIVRGRLRTLVPPGLTPVPGYSASSLVDHPASSSSSSNPFVPNGSHNNTSLRPKPLPRNNTSRHTDNLLLLPHRDAPSPPSELLSLPPGPSLIHPSPLLGPDIEIDTLGAFPRPPRTSHQHHRSPRTRLRSLLQDDRRTAIPPVSVTKPPPSPSPRAASGDTMPTPMDLSAIITSIQGSLYDDDETPRASPVDGSGQGSPSFSWIQELAA